MPWKKGFDEDAVLDRAMELFWERGYAAVSMNDLVEVLGVSRSSLYATYGQKDDLFLKALARYDHLHREEWLARLDRERAPIESLRQAFIDVAESPDGQRQMGCLLVNTTLEMSSAGSELGDLISEAFDSTETFFVTQIDRAKATGDLPATTDTDALAAGLMAFFLGVRVLSRANRASDGIDPILRQVDSMLQPV